MLNEDQKNDLPESQICGGGCAEPSAEGVVSELRGGDICGGSGAMFPVLAFQLIGTPEIIENTAEVQAFVGQLVAQANALPRDLESLAKLKATRAWLNRQFDEMESRRKAVKVELLAPYVEANKKYQERIANHFKQADAVMKRIIDGIQGETKKACEDSLRKHFNELRDALNLGFLRYEQCGIKIDMETAQQKEPVKAMRAIDGFLTKVSDDIHTISFMPDAVEVEMEYRRCLSVARAAEIVHQRHDEMNRLREETAAYQIAEQKRLDTMQKAAEAARMGDTEADEYTSAFTVTATMAQLKALKLFLETNGYKYKEE